MAIIWPLGTTFHVESCDGAETLTVALEQDISNKVVSSESPLGSALLKNIPGERFTIKQPDGQEVEFRIISARVDVSEELIHRYMIEPQGIRHDALMWSVCLNCGSQNVRPRSQKEHYYRTCQDCGVEWYVNNCWKCGRGRVDSRDPETPQCSVCGWYKCEVCGACKAGCPG